MSAVKPSISRETRVRARAEAAAWVAKLQSPQRSYELEAGLRRWLSADTENARQFERVSEIFDAAAQVGSQMPELPRLRRWDVAAPARRYAIAAAILVGMGLALFAGFRLTSSEEYSTHMGEQRVVRLEDSSRVTLNSNSRIRVRYDKSQRRIELEQGEAYFEVASVPARPFIVNAGTQQVRALGTSFVVRMDEDRLAVTLIEGKVAVSAQQSTHSQAAVSANSIAATQPTVLAPGERLILERSAAPHIDSPRLEAITAWRRGEVNLESTTLAEACAEMNRYDERALVLEEPKLAGLEISGIYHAGNSLAFAQTVAKLYALELTQEDGQLRLRSKNIF